MADLSWFNARVVAPKVAFKAIPSGNYPAAIVESHVKQTKAGTGHYLSLKFRIIDGPFKGRNLWKRLNVKHVNEDAVSMAMAELSAIYRAIGLETVKDSCELHMRPMVITVKDKVRANGEHESDISEYASIDSFTPGEVDVSPPWMR